MVACVLALEELQTGRFVIGYRFESWIGNLRRTSADHIANPELAFGPGYFANADQEFTFLIIDLSLQAQGVA